MRPDKLTVGDLLTTDSQVWLQSWDLRVLTRTALFSPVSRLSKPATVHPTGYREGVCYGGDIFERKDYMCGGVSGSQVISRVGKGDCLHSWASCSVV